MKLIDHGFINRVAHLWAVHPRDDKSVVFRDLQRRKIGRGQMDIAHLTLSIAIAVPWPTPMHMVAIPRVPPSVSSRLSSVKVMREPEEPSGWPKAIAPPHALVLSSSSPNSRMHAKDCVAK